ncbi:aldo/keto reductase [Streptomyces sp. NPDC006645]|uniref:aldo/keto reductase n=1 Tax=unclassified Streptomyces TaxID=2593676 RepID=UPI00339E1545
MPVESRQLGSSGPIVSRFAFGAMTFGGDTDEATAHEMLDVYAEAGGTLIDTADNYGSGTSERIVGRWLKARPGVRERVLVATKGRFGYPGASLTPAYLRGAIEASLARLGVEQVDLYQLHGPDDEHRVDEIVEFLAETVASGRARHVGVSNFAGWQVAKLARLLAERGGPPLVSQQIQYNLLARAVEWEVLPAGADAGVGTLLYGPLAQGWLTGKYRRDRLPPAGTRVAQAGEQTSEAWHRRNTDEVWSVVDAVREVAEAHGVTPGQAALAWVADRPGVTAPIVGARTVAQLRESLGAAALRLDEKATVRLTGISAPPTPNYPYQMIDRIAGWHG